MFNFLFFIFGVSELVLELFLHLVSFFKGFFGRLFVIDHEDGTVLDGEVVYAPPCPQGLHKLLICKVLYLLMPVLKENEDWEGQVKLHSKVEVLKVFPEKKT